MNINKYKRHLNQINLKYNKDHKFKEKQAIEIRYSKM